jgi:hypothetical protein
MKTFIYENHLKNTQMLLNNLFYDCPIHLKASLNHDKG